MSKSSRIQDVIFIALCSVLCCAVLVTFLLCQADLIALPKAELVKREAALKSEIHIPGLRQYDRAFERVRVGITDFSKAYLPGYDAMLEANTRANVAGNSALYRRLFGGAAKYVPVMSIDEGNIFAQMDEKYLFIMDPDLPKDPDGAVALINAAQARHPGLAMTLYLVPPLWLTDLPQTVDPAFDYPRKDMRLALDGLDPAVARGVLRCADIAEFESLFYSTDHHWRIGGAYRGYREILDLMRAKFPSIGQPAPLDSSKAQAMGGFHGALASVSAYDLIEDTVSDGGIQLPAHTMYVRAPSGKIMEFASVAQTREKLLSGERKPGKYENLYESFYMPTWLYTWFVYPENRTGRNLLIMGDSMRKCVMEPLASHYDTTYAVDVRYDSKFRFDAFVQEHGITDVLFLYSDSLNDLSRLYSAEF